MKEIANKYGFEFCIYIKKNESLNFIVGLSCLGENQKNNTIFIMGVNDDWSKQVENNQEFLFEFKIKKNEFVAFLKDLKAYIDNHIVPVNKIFSSLELDGIASNRLMMKFESQIDSFLIDYELDETFRKMNQRFEDLNTHLDDIQKKFELFTKRYE